MSFKDWKLADAIKHNERVNARRVKSDGVKVASLPDSAKAPCRAPSQSGTTLVITGQIRGGKNAIKTTRTGRRYPDKKWALWRDEKVAEVKAQIPSCYKHNGEQVNIRLDYYAGDKRRRDQPAVIDAIFHVLEKANFVIDDTHLWVVESRRSYDEKNPRAEITVL